MSLKLDISKAYNRIGWKYMKAIKRFGARSIYLTMECVTSISYSMFVNNQPRNIIKPMKIIR